jgi:replication factor C subunit 3/5
MFLIDKYTPKHKDDVFFHQQIYELLNNMSNDESIPHIIFHGMPGSGKKTMIQIFLEMLFDSSVHDIYEVLYKVTGSSNKTNLEPIKKSNYHIIIEPKNTNYDRYLIHNVIKEYAKRPGFNAYKTKRNFKIVQINNLDNLPYYAQTSLRRTMENYSSSCRFIMWCNKLSNVIRPIQSRCICIRLPRPSEKQMLDFMCYIAAMEDIKLSLNSDRKIITLSNGCTKTALWKMQFEQMGLSYSNDYELSICNIRDYILDGNIKLIKNIRDIIFKLYITNFPPHKILEDLITSLMTSNKISDEVKVKIMIDASEIEYNLTRSRRAIHHFDNMVCSVMKIVVENNNTTKDMKHKMLIKSGKESNSKKLKIKN